jgi:hypothetical protein
MELMRYFWDAAVVLDPAALESDEGRRFPICQPSPLVELLKMLVYRKSKCGRSTSLLAFAISTIIGRRSWAGKAPHRAMPCRWEKSVERRSGREFVRTFQLPRMDR